MASCQIVTRPDRIEAIAARGLFRLVEKEVESGRNVRIRDIAQTRHMLYWLGVVLDDA